MESARKKGWNIVTAAALLFGVGQQKESKVGTHFSNEGWALKAESARPADWWGRRLKRATLLQSTIKRGPGKIGG